MTNNKDIFKKDLKSGKFYFNFNNKKTILLLHNGNLIKRRNEIIEIFEKNRIPLKAKFEITGNCNFNCYYCYAKNFKNIESLNTKEIKTIIDKLDKIGIVFLELTGGEPLIRKDIVEILKYINKKNFVLTILSNGYFINNNIINILKNSNLFSFYISLLSPVEKHCDSLTGISGSFKKIILNIYRLKENNIPVEVNVTITKENIDYIENFIKLQEQLKINFNFSIDVDPVIGDVKTNFKYVIPEHKFNKIKKIFKSGINTEITCGAAQSHFLIDQQGNLLPCFKYRVTIGNLLKENFKKIWYSEKIVNILKKDFNKKFSFDECYTCKYNNFCNYCAGITRTYKNFQNGSYKYLLCYKPKMFYNLYNQNQN